uniref:Putative ovule protein n=1 Tax=Solanum chacoense TaxID=4108 RepID=A0A0V0GKW7_SOLCH
MRKIVESTNLFESVCLCFIFSKLVKFIFLHIFEDSETTSLSPRGSGKVCIHSTLPTPHLRDFTGYIVVVFF